MRHPPTVQNPSHWLLGPAYYVQRAPLVWLPKWIEEHGDIFTVKSPIAQATVVARPEWTRQVLVDHYPHYQRKSLAYNVLRILFGNGLVTSEGEFWRGQRKLINPAFHRHRLDMLYSMMVERIEDCAERLALQKGKPVDLLPILSHLTLDIISKAMFSTDVEGSASEVSRYIATLNEYALRMLRRPWLFLLPRKFPTPFNYQQHRALASLNQVVMGIIQARRRNPTQHDDLLSMLLSACEEETGKGMTDEQLRDEVMTIFVAGHETTANAVAWLIYLLSQNPEVEGKVIAEIDSHVPGATPTAEQASKLQYCRQAIEESLRMYPSIWSIGRRCNKEDVLGGFTIPEGMNVVIPIFYYHWSERFWSKPREFRPERFAPDQRPSPDKMIYFPFGAGPRSCIGNHFALQELLLMTAIFYKRFTFRLAPGFKVEPDPLITLRPKHGMQMMLEPR